jgi:hypothetical protein
LAVIWPYLAVVKHVNKLTELLLLLLLTAAVVVVMVEGEVFILFS